MRALVVFLLLLSSCADHTDFSGTYVGDGRGTHRLKDGKTANFTTPNDRVIVKMTSRHYQYSEIEVTVRNCVVRSDGGAGGLTSWTFSSERGLPCTFDVPSVGNVIFKVSGGLERRPPSRSSKPDEVQLSFYGTADNGDAITYAIDAKPRK